MPHQMRIVQKQTDVLELADSYWHLELYCMLHVVLAHVLCFLEYGMHPARILSNI